MPEGFLSVETCLILRWISLNSTSFDTWIRTVQQLVQLTFALNSNYVKWTGTILHHNVLLGLSRIQSLNMMSEIRLLLTGGSHALEEETEHKCEKNETPEDVYHCCYLRNWQLLMLVFHLISKTRIYFLGNVNSVFHSTFKTHIRTFWVKMAHLRGINVALMFSGFVILPVFWCITPELWQLLLLLSFHISSSLSTTLEIEIFCCRHFILVPSPRRPVNLPRRWENTTGLAIPFSLWKFALASENTEMHKKQACRAILVKELLLELLFPFHSENLPLL